MKGDNDLCVEGGGLILFCFRCADLIVSLLKPILCLLRKCRISL